MILLPFGFAVWALVQEAGIHATVAGVLPGFAIPVLRSSASGGPEAGPGLAEEFELTGVSGSSHWAAGPTGWDCSAGMLV